MLQRLFAELGESKKVYIEMPIGFRQQGKVLKLKFTLHELQQPPGAFWQYLTEAMVAVGMEVSKLDLCLFISKWVTAVAFVDDLLFWSTNEAYINDLAMKLHE